MSEKMLEDMPDRMSERLSKDMPDRVPERMSEDMPDRMPERMPEDMPARESHSGDHSEQCIFLIIVLMFSHFLAGIMMSNH